MISPIITELFLRRRKLNILLVFTSKSYLKVPKTIRLIATHCFIMKILNTRELQQITSNHLPNIHFKDFVKICKEYCKQLSHQIIHYDLGRTHYKMSISEKIKAIINKIKQKQSSM